MGGVAAAVGGIARGQLEAGFANLRGSGLAVCVVAVLCARRLGSGQACVCYPHFGDDDGAVAAGDDLAA